MKYAFTPTGSVKCQEVATVLQTYNTFFVTLCKNRFRSNLGINVTLHFKTTSSTALQTAQRYRVTQTEKQVDKQIINYVNNSGAQRFCLFLGV